MSESARQPFTIGDVAFDRVEFNAWVDDLTFWRGTKPALGRELELAGDHYASYDEDGELAQYYVYAARFQLERDGELRIALPGRPTVVLTREQVEPLLVDPNARREARERFWGTVRWYLHPGGWLQFRRRGRIRAGHQTGANR